MLFGIFTNVERKLQGLMGDFSNVPPVTYKLKFRGYWLDKDSSNVPDGSGIYCVYTCAYNRIKDTVLIESIVYIGESVNVNDRIQNHDLKSKWLSSCNSKQTLCYSFASIIEGRERVEAALIYHHQPIHNTAHRGFFLYPPTCVETLGTNILLAPSLRSE